MKRFPRSDRCGMWLLLAALWACDDDQASSEGPAASRASEPGVPPAELAQRVLAKVGERTITLGDYAEALARMDRFERLRYQTKERRQQLLNEMIQVELLAREAERRGLLKDPETQLEIRHLYREEMLRRLRDEQPNLDQLPKSEVKAYYDANPEQFSDPERRRVAVIAVRSRQQATEVAKLARGADAQAWGRLVREHSKHGAPSARGSAEVARPPLELAGDLGLVSAPGEPRGANPDVPEAVREAVFELEQPGQVAKQPVQEAGWFYVVRLISKAPARQRSFAEAETMIRARLLRERIEKAEAELVRKLRASTEVQVNETAMKRLKLPAAAGATGDGSTRP